MHPLAAAYFDLSEATQKQVHLYLLSKVLPVWQSFVAEHPSLTYLESVAGTQQTVDGQLPEDAVKAIEFGWDHAQVAERYLEPLAALQDGDLSLPEPIEFAYYAMFNAFRLHVLGEPLDHWLVVNQSLSVFGEEQSLAALAQALAEGADKANG